MNRVREIRQAKGLNQRELAELIHTPQSLLSAIELGKLKPWSKLMERLSDAFGVSVEELFPEDTIREKTGK